jgi:heptosyltransferase-2
LCGETNLVETIYLLNKAKILVTNDSGQMHLASVAKTPVVAIISARDFPLKWSPCPNLNKVLRVNTDCSPCFKDECNRDNLCLSLITVDDVWNGVKKIMQTYN